MFSSFCFGEVLECDASLIIIHLKGAPPIIPYLLIGLVKLSHLVRWDTTSMCNEEESLVDD